MPHDDAIDPFAQLERCHRRLEEACAALTEATERRDMETIANVAAFFARQIRRHEEDEDASLFPRLAGQGALADVLDRLRAEHRAHAELQARLDDGAAGRLEWSELEEVSRAIVRAFRAHITEEETHVFPAARATLSADDLVAMRGEMEARRGR